MTFKRTANPAQIKMLSLVLDEYCARAGIAVSDPLREPLAKRLMGLFSAGIDRSEELIAAMNTTYDEWLGEVGAAATYSPALTSQIDSVTGDNILPFSDRRGKAA
ncbi:hypothetical protein [Mesorhizobium sp. 128a]